MKQTESLESMSQTKKMLAEGGMGGAERQENTNGIGFFFTKDFREAQAVSGMIGKPPGS